MQSHTLLSNIKKISIKFRLVVLENALMGIPWYSPVKLTTIAIKIWNKPPNSDKKILFRFISFFGWLHSPASIAWELTCVWR
jgi:hypothetical protein